MNYTRKTGLLAIFIYLVQYISCCGDNIILTDVISSSHITSPNFGTNKTYPLNTYCQWNISSTNHSVVVLVVNHIDIEYHSACAWDYIRVYDDACGSGGTSTRYCGTILPPNITSISSQMCIEFKSDIIIARPGFDATVFRVIKDTVSPQSIPNAPCAASPYVINRTSYITSPNYGPQSYYPNNRICQWLVKTHNQSVHVTFESFEVESHPSCGYDSLTIYNGTETSFPVIHKLCGYQIPPSFIINQSSLFVFVSDVVVPRVGFRAILTFSDFPTELDPTFSTSNSLTTNPEPSTHSVINTTAAVITIISNPSGNQTSVDNFPISETATTQTPSETTMPTSTLYQASITPHMTTSSAAQTALLSSQSSTSNSSTKATPIVTSTPHTSTSVNPPTYQMCSNESLTITNAVYIVSPNFGDNQHYPLNTNCQLNIYTTSNTTIKVSFLTVDIEYNSACSWDYLILYDGSSDTSSKLDTLCGTKLVSYNSTGSSVKFHFNSDFIITKTGFKALIEVIDTDVVSEANSKSNTSSSVKDSTSWVPSSTTHSLSTISSASSTQKILMSPSSTTLISSSPTTPKSSTNNMLTSIISSTPATPLASVSPQTSPASPASPTTRTSPASSTSSMSSTPSKSPTLTSLASLTSSTSPASSISVKSPTSSTPSAASSAPPTSLTPPASMASPSSVSSSPTSTKQSSTSKISTSSTPTTLSAPSSLALSLTTPTSPASSSISTTESTSIISSTIAFVNDISQSVPKTSPRSVDSTKKGTTPVSDTVNICQQQYAHVKKPITVISPNFGQNQHYPNNKDCGLLVETTNYSYITVLLDTFEVEKHSLCSWDFLSLRDGNSTAEEIAKLCGSYVNTAYSSTQNLLYLHFHSDGVIPKSGFSLTVSREIKNEPTQQLSTVQIAKLTSSKLILSTLSQTTTMALPPTTTTTLPPTTTTLPPTTTTIPLSTTTTPIRLSTTTIPPPTTSTLPPAATTSIPPPTTTMSSLTTPPPTATTTIQEKTTLSTTLLPVSTTADIMAAACSGVPMAMRSSSGQIVSPGYYTGHYANNLDCQWVIQADLDKVIRLVFSTLDLEFQESCEWDYISIYDGSLPVGTPLGTYCGGAIPANITSSGTDLYIKFTSDRIVTKTGFKLIYTFEEPQNVSLSLTCSFDWVPCSSNGVCIPKEWLCDGEKDCLDNEDENTCALCKSNEVRCYDGSCLPGYEKCDGVAQCTDAEDEDGCTSVSASYHLLVMKSGKWFPVCNEGNLSTEFAHYACTSAGCPGHLNIGAAPSTDVTFAVPNQQLSNDGVNFHSKFKLSTTCMSKSTITLSCEDRICGMKPTNLPQAFIVGGSQSVRGEWPWVAAIYSGKNLVCGGTIVADRWILTAGHCVQGISHSPQTTSVAVGLVNLNQTGVGVQKIKVFEILVHPDHNFIYNADIALLRLQKPIVFTDNIRPLCLPTRLHSWSPSLPCYIAGWGVNHTQNVHLKATSENLHHAKIKLWPHSKCKAVYPQKLKDFMICAGYETGIIDACKGDSGGPLMCRTGDDNWQLVGITSWGEGCGEMNKPGVYTRVDHYIQWIKQTIQTTQSSVDCDFETVTVCGYTDQSNTTLMWTRRAGGSNYPSRPSTDVSLKNQTGYYMYAYIPYEEKGNSATLSSPILNLLTDSCLTFWFNFHSGSDAILKVIGQRLNASDVLLVQFNGITTGWRLSEVDLDNDIHQLLFVVQSVKRSNNGIAIDEIHITNSHCLGVTKLTCNFDGGNLCNYQQSNDDSGDWHIKISSLDSNVARSGEQDHHLEADGTNDQPGTKTVLVSPEINSTVPKCLSFKYKINPAYSHTLSVCTIVEFNNNSYSNCFHWVRTNSNNNDWTLAKALIPSWPSSFRIGIQAERKDRAGIVAVDEIKRRDGICPP